MKKLKMLVVLAIVLASCTTDSNQVQEDFTMEATVRNAILAELEAELSIEKGIPIKYDSYEMLKIDDSYYLRARSPEYVTTTLLGRNERGALVGLGVSCSSSSCINSTTECVPKWVGNIPTCTECSSGACTRTISSGVAVLTKE